MTLNFCRTFGQPLRVLVICIVTELVHAVISDNHLKLLIVKYIK